MNTLRIENHVHDYATWKGAFDKFEALRREKGVRAYRVTRQVDEPRHVFIDLDFDSVIDAEDFGRALAKIWRSPQSREQLVDHAQPTILDVLAEVEYS